MLERCVIRALVLGHVRRETLRLHAVRVCRSRGTGVALRSAIVWRVSRPASALVSTVTANPFDGIISNDDNMAVRCAAVFDEPMSAHRRRSSIHEMPIDSHMLPAARCTRCISRDSMRD